MVLKPWLTWDPEYGVEAGFAWKSWAYQRKVLTLNVIRGMQPGVQAFVDAPGPGHVYTADAADAQPRVSAG